MRIRVIHGIDNLESDLASMPARAERDGAAVVRKNAVAGNALAQEFACAKAGPHGKDYYKRLTAEAKAPLSWEYGPEGIPKTEFVGVGFRHGANNDLPQSADLIAPKLADDALDMLDGLFW